MLFKSYDLVFTLLLIVPARLFLLGHISRRIAMTELTLSSLASCAASGWNLLWLISDSVVFSHIMSAVIEIQRSRPSGTVALRLAIAVDLASLGSSEYGGFVQANFAAFSGSRRGVGPSLCSSGPHSVFPLKLHS